jgi:hypothetical protein
MARLLNTHLIPIKTELEKVESQRQAAESGAIKRREISQKLHDIGEMRDKPREATKILNELLRKYDKSLDDNDAN